MVEHSTDNRATQDRYLSEEPVLILKWSRVVMRLTVNQEPKGTRRFDPYLQSQVLSGTSYNGSTTDFDSVSLGSIPSVPSNLMHRSTSGEVHKNQSRHK